MANSANHSSERSLIGEGIRYVAIAVCLLSILCLVSYNPQDPSAHVISNRKASNWIGPIGANVAEWLFQLFGLAAFLLPVLMSIGIWRTLRTGRFRFRPIKTLGWLLLVLSFTGLLNFAPRVSHWLSNRPEREGAGGLIGYLVFQGLYAGLNTIGSAIVLALTFLLALMMTVHFSLESSVTSLRNRGLFFKPKEFLSGLKHRYQQWREERNERLRRRKEERARARAARASAREPQSISDHESDAEAHFTTQDADIPILKSQPVDPSSNLASETEQEINALAARNQYGSAKDGKPALAKAVASAAQTALEPPPKETAVTSVANNKQAIRVERKSFVEEPLPGEVTATEKSAKKVEARESEYILPSPDMLTAPPEHHEQADAELMERANQLINKCKEFAVTGQVSSISPGPVVTTFEFKPDPGVKYSRVVGLVDDLCLAMKAESIRIDRMPGKSTVGIEVPNLKRDIIFLREVIESKKYKSSPSKLTIALGKTIDGQNYITDLSKMPHLLIAGATGAGKSVTVNSIIMSILFKATPEEVKFIMVDPKRLELGLYDGIPHLLTPIVTDPKRASNALRWAVGEMENRYRTLAGFGVRNIDQYNREILIGNLEYNGEEEPRPLPYIVIVIDELADLMMVASNDVETSITRLAQMARAVGIHLVLATQRPSVDVITGLIKANFPSRISFRVSSKVDSRTIIDANGAEQLLGQGDMLFLPPGTSRLVRVHGSFVNEEEIKRIVAFIKQQAAPVYDETILMSEKEIEEQESGTGERDELYYDALRIVIEMGRASTSVLQRRLRIGYGRAAAILDMMQREGIIGPPDGSRPRQVLVKADFLERLEQIKEEEE